jgi:class 3 adenylate cyclase
MAGIAELPEGPVTIMFTDIEGSTALRTSLGDTETDALFRQHDEIVRAQIEENRGHDQKAALGDGFLAVFVSTRRALACAIGIQRALDSFNRNRAGQPLRVRIGLNTGEVAWQDGQLSGEAVHAAARV